MDVLQVRVVLRVRDLERAISFYRDALGLPLRERWEQAGAPGALFDTGHGQIQVYASNGAEPAPAPPTVMLLTADVDRDYARLTASGVTTLWGPASTDWGTRQVAVQDPDGTVIVLCSAAPSSNPAAPTE